MIPLIGDVARETWLVLGWFVLACFFTARFKTDENFFPRSLTAELKGVAILMIVIGHVGYFLINDHRFLVPLSNFMGVGVSMFLLVSGYGLMTSSLSRPLTILEFYKRRLFKVWLPVLTTVILLTVLDYVFLDRTYPIPLTVKNLFGFFPSADLWNDINSPLWFITPLLAYYILFPLFAPKRAPYLAPLLFGVLAFLITREPIMKLLPVTESVTWLYRGHAFSFAIGTAIALLLRWIESNKAQIKQLFSDYSETARFAVKTALCVALFAALSYFATHSFYGQGWKLEQFSAVSTAILILILGIIKPVEIGFLRVTGDYSFLLYLAHWPLMARYDLLFTSVRSGVAMVLYIGLFLGIGFVYSYVKSLRTARAAKAIQAS